ncbi:MAG TPA: membrane-bound PQQ-dependent dehydrogenase, glucose/quinate/shikimate family [Phenylobacterium sp.]
MRRLPRALFSALLGLVGGALLVGGISLLSLGGSPYYAVVGLLVLASAVMHGRGSPWGDRLYAVVLAATLLWALAEAGLAPWALVARLLAPAGLGLAFLVGRKAEGPLIARISLAGAASLVGIGVTGLSFVLPGAFSTRVSAAAEAAAAVGSSPTDTDWLHYANDTRGTRFAPLTQITPANAGRLEVAWIHRSGIAPAPAASAQATPLKVGDTLYTCAPNSVVMAIDARTGKERWRFDPRVGAANYAIMACRGVSYARVGAEPDACAGRILATTIDARLFALDAKTGRPCSDFGANGQVSLLDGIGPVSAGAQYTSSPPASVKGHVVLGGMVVDNQSANVASGVIRAFDPVTGALQWAWDMGAPERVGAPPPGQTYTRSTPNSWSSFAVDEALNLVYVPTGNPSPDFFGGLRRPFDDRYGSSIVALDLDTGRPRWSFQTVHHDLWDYDVPAQPLLVDLRTAAGPVPAVVQATKQGQLYVLDRRTGRPIVRVTERPVPQGVVGGDRLSPTQPFSALSVTGARLTEASMWGATPIDQMMCRIKFRQSRYDGMYTPAGTDRPTIVSPGLSGAINWGSLSLDGDRNILVVNSMNFPWRLRLVPRAAVTREIANARWTPLMTGTPYAAQQEPFLGPLQTPCVAPPWGYLQAIDLRTNEVLWKRTLGTARDSGPLRQPSMLPLPIGVPNQGGAVTTRGGVIFIGATLDRYIRAFDLRSGRELWKARLPAGGQATPMTYMSGGRQYVVITAGGHSFLETRKGDYTIAYALPAR